VYGHSDQKITEVVERVNKFYAARWPEYRTLMEKVSFQVFKDYEPIKKQ
jgi:hypothetical protein